MTYSLTLGDLGINVAGVDLSPSVLISKRKRPAGYGHIPNLKGATGKNDVSRFWIGAPVPDANKVRPLDSDYGAFNDERLSASHLGWVSSLPVQFGSPLEEHVRTYSRGFYRWSTKDWGQAPPIYQAPASARPWCTTRGVDQSASPTARRWVDSEFRNIPCPGEGCPFSSGRGGNPSPCKKNAQIYVWPRWEALAARVEADGTSEAHALFAKRVRQFPIAPVKLITGGEFGPSVKAFAVFMQWVRDQAETLLGKGAWPVPLVGLPFTLGVTKHSGPRQYTIYTFKPSGNFADWLLSSEVKLEQLRSGRRMLFLGGETPGEQTDEMVSADLVEPTSQVVATLGPAVKPAVTVEPAPEGEARPEGSSPEAERCSPSTSPGSPSGPLSTSDKIGAWMEENDFNGRKSDVTRALGEADLVDKGKRWYDCAEEWDDVKPVLDTLTEKGKS